MTTRARSRVLAASALTALLGLAGCGEGGGGGLGVSPGALEFGSVFYGDTVDRSLSVTNESKRDLMITAIDANCTCFVIDPSYRKTLVPGESTDVRVSLYSRAGALQPLRGKFLQIRTDLAESALVKVPLRGDVLTPYSVTPESIRFDALLEGPQNGPKHGPWRIEIRARTGYTLKLVSIERLVKANPTALATKSEEVAGGFDVVVTLDPTAKGTGDVDEAIAIKVAISGRGVTGREETSVVNIRGSW